MKLTPKNWSSFQHYKHRSPPWIKLHRSILDDYEFHCLPVASRALAPLLWLLASDHENGIIECSYEKLAYKFRQTTEELKIAVKPLIDKGFFECLQDASDLLSDCKQNVTTEKRRVEKSREERVRFAPPTLEEVTVLMKDKGYPNEAPKFYNFYAAKDWMMGKNKMKSWTHAAAGWMSRIDKPAKIDTSIPEELRSQRWT